VIGRAANKCGGVVVEELLGHSPPFPIADFWFEEYGIVAELKVMEQDMFSNEDFIQQTTDLYRTWVDRGFDVPIVLGSRPVSTKDIPPECSIELLGLIKAKIKNAFLRKANKQIRSTKKKLGKPDSFGLLLLGNDGSMGFHPSLIANLLHHSLANQYRSIEGVIYFTGNCKAKFPGFLEPAYYWANMAVENRRPLCSDFEKRFRETWQLEVSAATKEWVMPVDLPRNDFDYLDQVKLSRS